MKNTIRHAQDSDEFYIDEGCYITELSNSADDGDVSIARARVPPGVTTRRHRLDGIAERYCILAGQGRVETGDLPATDVSVGDVVLIPPGCAQRIANTGNEDLVFLALCTPRFDMDAYQDIEETPTGG